MSARAINRRFGYGVHLFEWWYQRVPVFHLYGSLHGRVSFEDGDPTLCGRPTVNPETRADVGRMVPTVHAVRFARPCKRCLAVLERKP
jgi:hypothetical protein